MIHFIRKVNKDTKEEDLVDAYFSAKDEVEEIVRALNNADKTHHYSSFQVPIAPNCGGGPLCVNCECFSENQSVEKENEE